ncbi:MAG TPA: phage tail protein [Thermoanaerobaculia bacterium]|jgi:phage tail-like protein|nr:phage tail protein [Thermoanaerobaculia bacterium]
MPAVFREDPYGGFNFEVIVKGVSDDGTAVRGSFAEASGLDAEVKPIDYRNGSEDIRVRKLPGLKSFPVVKLVRGQTGDLAFWNWIVEAMNGLVQRTDVSVVLLDENRNEVMRWNLVRAWACKWSGPGLNAKNSEIAMETLEICHEGLSIDGQTG